MRAGVCVCVYPTHKIFSVFLRGLMGMHGYARECRERKPAPNTSNHCCTKANTAKPTTERLTLYLPWQLSAPVYLPLPTKVTSCTCRRTHNYLPALLSQLPRASRPEPSNLSRGDENNENYFFLLFRNTPTLKKKVALVRREKPRTEGTRGRKAKSHDRPPRLVKE